MCSVPERRFRMRVHPSRGEFKNEIPADSHDGARKAVGKLRAIDRKTPAGQR